jgi:hypothetical protein
MIWYLVFCSLVNGGSVCLPPQKVESEAICRVLGDKMRETSAIMFGQGRARCVGVKRL